MKPHPLTACVLIVALLPAIVASTSATAQIDVPPQVIPGSFSSTFTATPPRNTQASNIVISVRDFGPNDDFCGNSLSFSLPRPGSFGDGFDFPHAGRQAESFPHPGRTITSFPGGATTYFQLPTGVRTPDMIGCVDTQRNTVFITIRPQRSVIPSPPQPQPEPSPTPIPIYPPSTQPAPINSTPVYPQTQILRPRQTQFFPMGGGANNPSLR